MKYDTSLCNPSKTVVENLGLSSEGTFATDAIGCRGKSLVIYWKRQARAKALKK